MYKVFYKNKYLLISDKNTKCNACLPIKSIDNSFINDFLDENIKANYFYFTNIIDEAIDILKKQFNYIKAAGGIVKNTKNEILLIKHYNVWDLPKGWIELNETETSAAIREVSEECGISNHFIEKKLTDTFHIYQYNDTYNLKHSIWFLMNYNGNEELKPQISESISEARWVSINNLDKYYDNMYDNIIDLLKLIYYK